MASAWSDNKVRPDGGNRVVGGEQLAMNFILMTTFPQIIIFSSLAPVQAQFYLDTSKRILVQHHRHPTLMLLMACFHCAADKGKKTFCGIRILCGTLVHNIFCGLLTILVEAYVFPLLSPLLFPFRENSKRRETHWESIYGVHFRFPE